MVKFQRNADVTLYLKKQAFKNCVLLMGNIPWDHILQHLSEWFSIYATALTSWDYPCLPIQISVANPRHLYFQMRFCAHSKGALQFCQSSWLLWQKSCQIYILLSE